MGVKPLLVAMAFTAEQKREYRRRMRATARRKGLLVPGFSKNSGRSGTAGKSGKFGKWTAEQQRESVIKKEAQQRAQQAADAAANANAPPQPHAAAATQGRVSQRGPNGGCAAARSAGSPANLLINQYPERAEPLPPPRPKAKAKSKSRPAPRVID